MKTKPKTIEKENNMNTKKYPAWSMPIIDGKRYIVDGDGNLVTPTKLNLAVNTVKEVLNELLSPDKSKKWDLALFSNGEVAIREWKLNSDGTSTRISRVLKEQPQEIPIRKVVFESQEQMKMVLSKLMR